MIDNKVGSDLLISSVSQFSLKFPKSNSDFRGGVEFNNLDEKIFFAKSELNMNSLHLPTLKCDVDIPKLDSDVDLDELDFEVLPWLRNFGEFINNEDPDGPQICELCGLKFSCQRSFKKHQKTHLHVENSLPKQEEDQSQFGSLSTKCSSNHSKKQFQCNICLKNSPTKHTCTWLPNVPKPNPFTNSVITTTLVLTKEVITSTPKNSNSEECNNNDDPDRDRVKDSNLSKKQTYKVVKLVRNHSPSNQPVLFFKLIDQTNEKTNSNTR